jgi:uncharacterized protein with PIN domain
MYPVHQDHGAACDCLSQEIEADQFISALADDELRLIVANSVNETASALEALKRYT